MVFRGYPEAPPTPDPAPRRDDGKLFIPGLRNNTSRIPEADSIQEVLRLTLGVLRLSWQHIGYMTHWKRGYMQMILRSLVAPHKEGPADARWYFRGVETV